MRVLLTVIDYVLLVLQATYCIQEGAMLLFGQNEIGIIVDNNWIHV